MSIQRWSDRILIVELQNDPAFSDDMLAVGDELGDKPHVDLIMDFSGLTYLNSSNIAKLLKVRKLLLGQGRRLILAGATTQVYSMFIVTGLEKIFEFVDNTAEALATIQLSLPSENS